MKFDQNPLTPHLQVYKWQISSLLSISNRIVGVFNFFIITLVCLWLISLLFGTNGFDFIQKIINSIFGNFILISLCWSFSFQILNELRHLFWDFGYGLDVKISKITGMLIVVCSFLLAILLFIIGKTFFLICIHQQKNGYL